MDLNSIIDKEVSFKLVTILQGDWRSLSQGHVQLSPLAGWAYVWKHVVMITSVRERRSVVLTGVVTHVRTYNVSECKCKPKGGRQGGRVSRRQNIVGWCSCT